MDVPYRSEREYLARKGSKEWQEYVADLEEQARLNPSNGQPRSDQPAIPTVATMDMKAEKKARRVKRKAREWKPSFDGQHRGY